MFFGTSESQNHSSCQLSLKKISGSLENGEQENDASFSGAVRTNYDCSGLVT